MTRKLIAAAIAGSLALGGCASQSERLTDAQERQEVREYKQQLKEQREQRQTQEIQDEIDSIPQWAIEPPVTVGGEVYGVGTATSQDPAKAMRKAKLKAEFALAQSIRQSLSGEERQQERDGSRSTSEYQLLIDRFVDSVPLRGHRVEDQQLIASEGEARAYILMKISADKLQEIAQGEKDTFVDETSKEAFERLEDRMNQAKEEGSGEEEPAQQGQS